MAEIAENLNMHSLELASLLDGLLPMNSFVPIKTARIEQMEALSWIGTHGANNSMSDLAAYTQAIRELDQLGELEDGWDGEGANAIDNRTITAARALLSIIRQHVSMPDIEPNPSGTISLLWTWITGRAELEIGSTRHSWAVIDQSSGRKETSHCSGENRILLGTIGASDLVSAILSSRNSTAPISDLRMAHSWMTESAA